MSCAELHVTCHDLIIITLLCLAIEQPIVIRDCEVKQAIAYLVSPFETKPMLPSGSCLTGRSLSHGAEDFRASGWGACAILLHDHLFTTLRRAPGSAIPCYPYAVAASVVLNCAMLSKGGKIDVIILAKSPVGLDGA